MERLIFHIDLNSAYLSWEAAYRFQHGEELDLRDIPSVVGGDEASRHGIVLTKSIPAKKYGIKTGETLYQARAKCPELVVVPPRYWVYMQCSHAMPCMKFSWNTRRRYRGSQWTRAFSTFPA